VVLRIPVRAGRTGYNGEDSRSTRPEIQQERRWAVMLCARKEAGQGLVEYALILVMVTIVVFAALLLLGPVIGNVFSTINSSLPNLL
jgi:pilus assembly protein Flp/PilA